FSFGNALLALQQCTCRNLQPGPLNTYNGWLERKRQVRKGEKGITLCMPMPFKKVLKPMASKTKQPNNYALRFRSYGFVLAQNEGESILPIPGLDIERALAPKTSRPRSSSGSRLAAKPACPLCAFQSIARNGERHR